MWMDGDRAWGGGEGEEDDFGGFCRRGVLMVLSKW